MSTPVEIAKAPTLAYNAKDWNALRTAVTPGFVYDEVATQRRIEGIENVIEAWQGWARAIPDSAATIHTAVASGNTVILELTWRGTHAGPLQTPGGEIPATGKLIEIRSCQVVEIEGERVQSMRQYFDMMTLLQQIGAGVTAV